LKIAINIDQLQYALKKNCNEIDYINAT